MKRKIKLHKKLRRNIKNNTPSWRRKGLSFLENLEYNLMDQFYPNNDCGGGHRIEIKRIDYKHKLLFTETIEDYGGSRDGHWYMLCSIRKQIYSFNDNFDFILESEKIIFNSDDQ